jgi:hypothetical protein
VLVRARAKKDLEQFREKYCKRLGPITFLDWSDYPYRATVGRWAFAHAMFKISLDLTYTNFKSSVKDNKRHNVYMKVWTVMREAERNGDMGDEQAAKRGRAKQYHRGYTPSTAAGQRFFEWHGDGQWWLDDEDEDRGKKGKAKKGNGKAKKMMPSAKARDADIPDLPIDPPSHEELCEREEQMARDAGVFDDDIINDPFGWDDGLGGRSESYDDEDPDGDAGMDRGELADEPGGVLEFDSINDVINHFKAK